MCTNMAVMAFVIWVPQDLRSREWKLSIDTSLVLKKPLCLNKDDLT